MNKELQLSLLVDKLDSVLNWEPDYEQIGIQVGPGLSEAYFYFKEIRKLDKKFTIPKELYSYIKENNLREKEEVYTLEHSEYLKTLPDKWKTAQGEVIRIEEMKTSHIRNTIKFIKNRNQMYLTEGAKKFIIAFELELKKRL